LTDWHSHFRNAGLDTTLVNHNNGVYYEDNGYLYDINATSQLVSPSGHKVIVQHVLNASRLFLSIYQPI
jgi:hypothetical protein